MIAILCAMRNSIYFKLPDLDVYDDIRDCRTFKGACRVITHAPCRGYSAFCRHQSKPLQGEMELAWFCLEKVRANGGIFEHPMHSTFFKLAGIKPTLMVEQGWFGYPLRKKTWLYFVDCAPAALPHPLIIATGSRRKEQLMSHNQRHQTNLTFATWLINSVNK